MTEMTEPTEFSFPSPQEVTSAMRTTTLVPFIYALRDGIKKALLAPTDGWGTYTVYVANLIRDYRLSTTPGATNLLRMAFNTVVQGELHNAGWISRWENPQDQRDGVAIIITATVHGPSTSREDH